MKWMYCFTPALRYRTVARSEGRAFANGFFGLAFSLAPWAVGAFALVSLLQYSVSLLFIYKLSTLVAAQDSVEITQADTAFLALLAVSGFLLVVSELNLERYISLGLCREFECLLTRKMQPRLEVSVLERVVSRDFSVILDGIGASVNLLVIPVFLLLSILLALLVFGAAGLWALAVIGVFLPLSYLLSRFSDRNYQRIMDMAAQRIEQCSVWLRKGPWLKQFADRTNLQGIERTLATERSLRNLDTLLRGADSYIIGFGRLIPFVMLGLLGTSESAMVWDGAIFWLSIPLLAAVLALPRSYVSYRAVGRSLEALNGLYRNSSTHLLSRPVAADQACSVIEFDADWPIWPAVLAELIPGPLERQREEMHALLSAFRLVPELGQDPRQVLQLPVELDASNLSAGQRLRLQLLRGVFLARTLGGTLSIDHDFSTLDAAAAQAVKDALERLPWISFSLSAASAIAQREGSAQVAERMASTLPVGSPAPEPYGLGDLFKYCRWGVLILLVPALMMSYAANLTLPEAGFSSWQVLLYVVAGVGAGIVAGLLIESLLRSRFSRLFIDGLRDIRVTGLADALQVISRDVTTTFERIAWYAHDIAWIIALLLCNGVALWMGFGLFGIAVALLFSGLLAVLYRLSINELYRARVQSVSGFDSLLRSAHVAFSISQAAGMGFERLGDWLALAQRGAIAEGVKHFYTTRLRSVITRTVTAASCTLLSDLVIVLVVLMGSLYRTDDSAFVLAVTALLLVRSDLANVFLAITGFKSQSVSVERLQHFARPKRSVAVAIAGHSLRISPFVAQRAYRALSLERGRLYSLSGHSGSGKSEYLKGVAGITDVVIEEEAEVAQVMTSLRHYLDSSTLALLGGEPGASSWLDTWLSALPPGRHHLLLLDEPFSALPAEQLAERVQALRHYVERSGNTLVLVDHRCRLEHDIELAELAIGDYPVQGNTHG
ncbi:ATP-binding cassette domain-containing protein [Pseudomonas oryziphila]|uniref:ABC-type bacteriocin/lantibiotic exporter, contains an N-terminal double-glycine peptidase domain n=1 Tax=Pseudomonas oryziphila TaxID=2894079 RepID=A0ABN5TBZ4_9PSED|nr:hypothetical protein [Pseudomonas oryziphila]AZL72415.1 hypothetical protein EI693_04650 [Pseudomonas oryziphila]